MIEVEKKFILTEQDRERLTKHAQFINERVFTDVYYDTSDFSLTSHDTWLRSREGKFELKISLHHHGERTVDQYDECEDEQQIREVLKLPNEGDLASDLSKNGYLPFCICRTTRKKYKKDPFIIDLDVVDFKEFTYTIGEIELMVNEKAEIEDAIAKIMVFAQEQKLTIAPVRGKVIEYLKRMRPDHYDALVRVGTVKDF